MAESKWRMFVFHFTEVTLRLYYLNERDYKESQKEDDDAGDDKRCYIWEAVFGKRSYKETCKHRSKGSRKRIQ